MRVRETIIRQQCVRGSSALPTFFFGACRVVTEEYLYDVMVMACHSQDSYFMEFFDPLVSYYF